MNNKLAYLFVTAVASLMLSTSMAGVASENLVVYLPFNGNANDVTGNGYDAVVNGATLTSDRFGRSNSAYAFDGTNDYINLGEIGEFHTVSLWIKQEVRSDHEMYFGHDDFRLFAYSSGRIILHDDSANGVDTAEFIDDFIGEWIHLVAVTDSTNSKIYLNGTNVSTTVDNLNPVLDSVVNLGRWPSSIHYYNGKMDDVRIYNKALTEEEVQMLYRGSSFPLSIYRAVEIKWPTVSEDRYQVQYSTNLVSTNWFDLGESIIGDGSTNGVFDSTILTTKRFYRVIRK